MVGEVLRDSYEDEGCPIVEVAPLSIGIETSGEAHKNTITEDKRSQCFFRRTVRSGCSKVPDIALPQISGCHGS